MEKRAYILRANGQREDLDHRPNYEETVKIVGGFIEFAHCQAPARTLVVDEEGRQKGYPLNEKATQMYGVSPIVGDVLVLEGWRTIAS